ncbi:MAG TPA: glycosyltransferase family 9 protein, partial [Herpetosiphonaceae bacterium]|nr:glycosyltransferase family 9 protein [Herpetosiphonaceae bacterium]
GDVLLLTPALGALRERYPAARITAMVGPWATRLLEGNGDVDAVISCPFPGFVRGAAAGPLSPYLTLARFAALLRAGRFDTAIVARDDHWWGGLLALGAGIGRRIGFHHPLLAPSLTTALPWDAKDHVTAQALALVEGLPFTAKAPGTQSPQSIKEGALTQRPRKPESQSFDETATPDIRHPDSRPPVTFRPTAAERDWAAEWVGRHAGGRPLIAIQPGSGGAAKLWPAERWAALARDLAASGALVLTGGPADSADVAAVSALLAAPHQTLVGATSLGQLAALFGRCALVLGVDNGPLHLAVSQSVPTVHLFGPGDHGRFGPWGDPRRHVVVRSGLWCSPCGVLSHCPRQTSPSECMATISVSQVLRVAGALLAAQPPSA